MAQIKEVSLSNLKPAANAKNAEDANFNSSLVSCRKEIIMELLAERASWLLPWGSDYNKKRMAEIRSGIFNMSWTETEWLASHFDNNDYKWENLRVGRKSVDRFGQDETVYKYYEGRIDDYIAYLATKDIS
ncbi:MAG: hypothetical protein V4691_06095 [Pseudomonadota bacterium]